MMKDIDSATLLKTVWPDYDEFWAMSEQDQHAYALKVLNELLGNEFPSFQDLS